MSNRKTVMRYQVEGSGVVQQSGITSLRWARRVASELTAKGCLDVKIARCDVSGVSRHYEIVEPTSQP